MRSASPGGGGSKPQVGQRPDYRTICWQSEYKVFSRKSIHSASPSGGGSKPQVGQRSDCWTICWQSEYKAFLKKSIHSADLVGVDLGLRSASAQIAGPHAGGQNTRFS